MYVGRPILCLKVSDLAASQRFYEALGLQALDATESRVVMRRGSFCLALMTFLEEDLLNLRGADAFAVRAHLQSVGLNPTGTPQHYKKEEFDADADGTCWPTSDPDGHALLFDTNEREVGPAAQQRLLTEILKSTEQDLLDLGASDECLTAFRQHVLHPFALRDPD